VVTDREKAFEFFSPKRSSLPCICADTHAWWAARSRCTSAGPTCTRGWVKRCRSSSCPHSGKRNIQLDFYYFLTRLLLFQFSYFWSIFDLVYSYLNLFVLILSILRRHDSQHNDIQHDGTQHNDTQHNNAQHNNTQQRGIIWNMSVIFYSLLCWMSLCWMSLCWMSLCWMSLCWMSLCWISLYWKSSFIYCYAKCHCAESLYAECHYSECHYAECHNVECQGADYLTIFTNIYFFIFSPIFYFHSNIYLSFIILHKYLLTLKCLTNFACVTFIFVPPCDSWVKWYWVFFIKNIVFQKDIISYQCTLSVRGRIHKPFFLRMGKISKRACPIQLFLSVIYEFS